MNSSSFGKAGEDAACLYLKKNSYKILERNFTTGIGEIDIIAEKGGCTAFIEVKTRQSEKFGLPKEAVGFFKQKKYSQVAMQYIKKTGDFYKEYRFDVIEVLEGAVNHIENAFSLIK